ncbi:MAG: M48 family metallopeptidase [Rikenellaceae bacterium]
MYARELGLLQVKSKIIDPELGEITLSQTKRARRLTIRVSGSGVLSVSYPTTLSTAKALEFVDSRREWIIKARAKVASRIKAIPNDDIEQLRAEAKEYLPKRMEEICSQTGLKYNKLTLRLTRSKWGSCSGENNISLSILLMSLPKHLIDYVIIHELSHTVHHNHSAAFHALVDRLCHGREKELAAELRGYTTSI